MRLDEAHDVDCSTPRCVRRHFLGAGASEKDRGKRNEKWLWWIREGERTTTTPVRYTEEEIRQKHPGAVRVESTRVLEGAASTQSKLPKKKRRNK